MKPSELHVNNCGFFYDDSCVTVPVQLTSATHLLKILFKTATFRVLAGSLLTPLTYSIMRVSNSDCCFRLVPAWAGSFLTPLNLLNHESV